MIDRTSLSWQVGIRLTAIMVILTMIGIGWLVVHTTMIEAAHGPSNLVHAVIREFFLDLAWGVPIFIGLIILIGAWALRRALAPLRDASRAALAIGPDALDARIPTSGLPSEILPLVQSANEAFDRVEEAYRAQQRFTATAAHELRTPIAIARAAVERLPASPDQQAAVADMQRLSRLAAQLLELARVERPLGAKVHTDLVEEIRRVAAELAASVLAARDVRIALDLPGRLMVRGDPERLYAIMRNLIENAGSHEPTGGEVEVTLSNDGTLEILDHGPGIPVEERERIFGRFERGNWTSANGSGLGLAIVRDACSVIGASVEVDTAPSGGALLRVNFART
jgi:signal transduction histidine kinase